MLPSERRTFVNTHRTCVFGYWRHSEGPSMSVLYYVPTDDVELLVSIMAGRAKAKAVERLGKPLHRNDQAERVTHWLSGSVPWDADDPVTVQ
jgi:hypothetical protein